MDEPIMSTSSADTSGGYFNVIETYLSSNPYLGKEALVSLLMARYPILSCNEAWIIVARYFNHGVEFRRLASLRSRD